jgi:hypothetical protein
MHEFSSVIFDMHVMDTKSFELPIDKCTDFPALTDRLIHLSNLISHRQIRVEITLSIEKTLCLRSSAKCMRGSHGEVDNPRRKSREHTRKSHTDRTDIDIWLWGKLDRICTGTKHFCM